MKTPDISPGFYCCFVNEVSKSAGYNWESYGNLLQHNFLVAHISQVAEQPQQFSLIVFALEHLKDILRDIPLKINKGISLNA